MNEIKVFLSKLEELSNPETYISEIHVKGSGDYWETEDGAYYSWVSEGCNPFFAQLWDERHKECLRELVWYCGPSWDNYAFDVFFSEFKNYEVDYYIHTYIEKSSTTIARYFTDNPKEIFKPVFEHYPKTWKTVFKELPPKIEQVSKRFYYDLSDFLSYEALKLIKGGDVDLIDRKRLSKVTGKYFLDSRATKSISYANRRIPEWDLQNYHIEIASNEFDPFRRTGSDRDVEDSLPYLRELLELQGFVPTVNTSIWGIYRNLPRDKFVQFIRMAKNVFYPIRYADVYGEWLKAVVATGYLGEEGVLKTNYGYRVISKDGHVCNSLSERIVDDWLFDNHIEHEKEPSYPSIVREIIGANVRADWKVGDIYIEYFGLQVIKSYAKKTASKILACQAGNVFLVPLYPGDEFKLERTLLPYLKMSQQHVENYYLIHEKR
jgi:hypothetical protein